MTSYEDSDGKINNWAVLGILIGLLLVGALILFGLWRAIFVTNVDNYELGFTFDRFSGKIEKTGEQGWIIRNPIRYSVHVLDLRPYQISLTADISAGSRILNAKLVRFNPEGLDTFVEWHGRSAGDSLHNLKEIMKCYAFDKEEGRDCPFITILQDVAPTQNGAPRNVAAGGK